METIKGFENYEIDTEGNVWSKISNKFLKKQTCSRGYLRYDLIKDKKRHKIDIHRLLGLQFIDNPNNLEMVDHIDQNKLNNNLDNLRWVTRSQNNRNKQCKGYTWHKASQKWRVDYKLNNKKHFVGLFKTEEEAREAYLNAIKDL